MNEERCQMGASLYQRDFIFVFGGIVGKSGAQTDTIECYDTFKNTWTTVFLKLPQKLSGLSCLEMCRPSCKGILIVGGIAAGNKPSKYVYFFNGAPQSISAVAKMYYPRTLNNKVFATNEGKCFLIGGNFDYNYEVYDLRHGKLTYNESFSYADLIKNDLSLFSAAYCY